MITTDTCKDTVDLLKRDEYICDMIDIKINSKMSVSTLYALEMIFYLFLSEKRVNTIAAEIYAKIDSLAGKYKMMNLTA